MAVVTIVVLLLVAVTGSSAHHHAMRRPSPRHVSAAAAAVAARASLARREDAAIVRLLKRQPYITAGGDRRREIALTFDDGPGPYTPRILAELRRLHVPATFLEVGAMIRYFFDWTREEARMPDVVIGDHTETHPMMADLSRAGQQSEILQQTRELHRYGVPFPHLYRPPYGSFDRATFSVLRRERMLMVLWTVDTSDYERPGVAQIVHAAVAGARPGAIILMHDAGGDREQTIAALPTIVRDLRARGYELVTVPRLILDDPPASGQTLPSHLSGG